MKLHEYQAKALLKKHGIPVPEGVVITDPDQAVEKASLLKGPPWAVKAQVHSGGRGKGGGVILVSSRREVKDAAEGLLGKRLITKQTGEKGCIVNQVLIEQGIDIADELYLAMLVDRSQGAPAMVFSAEGGMEIEEVAEKTPQLISRQYIHPKSGWMPYMARNLIYSMERLPSKEAIKNLTAVTKRLYELFIENDCSLAEINPLVITGSGEVVALDAKITIDDNALFRQKRLAALYDKREKDPLEVIAEEHNLNYIHLDGNIGAMVNGAGLAMATMDVIKSAGAEPANFLDVGGGANEEMITRALEIILMDKRVKAILINIFGGILRCDVLARGVLAAARKTKIEVPLIVRLEGTNVDEGRRILESSELKFLVAKDLGHAAELVAGQVSRHG